MAILHHKIKELQKRAKLVTYSGAYVDQEGNIQNLDFKISTSEGTRTIKGYLSVWGVKDTFGTVFIKGSFAKSIAERGPDSSSKQKIAHLWQHDPCDPTGRFTVLKEDNYGLYFEAELDEVPSGDRELTQVRSGTLNQFSVGFDYVWDKMEYDEASDAILIKEAVLMEGSVVTFGSCEETYAIRTPKQMEVEKESLREDTEYFLRTVSRKQQLELRQLITRHISLAQFKPDESRALEDIKPKNKEVVEIGNYKLDTKQFKK